MDRVVLDNTSLAVKDVLAGRDRVQTEAFRGGYPFRAEFCAPAKGWEKGSVETGVKYVNLVFRPRLAVESWAALNAAILTELEADLPTRQLDDGRPVEEALAQERQRLRTMPAHLPATCRVVARVADKFGHVRVDRVSYSVPIRHAYRPVWAKLYHDRVALAVGAEVVAEHPRAFVRGAKVLDALHVLPLLERKNRARGRGDGASRLAAGPGVAAGADGAGEAHAQARSGMGPDAAADGDSPGPGRRARGDGRARAPFAASGDGAAHPPSAAGRPAAGVPAGRERASGAGADRGARAEAVGV